MPKIKVFSVVFGCVFMRNCVSMQEAENFGWIAGGGGKKDKNEFRPNILQVTVPYM